MLADIWSVVRFEYARIVFRKQFLLVLISPLLILLVFGVVVFFMILSLYSNELVGYVDLTGKMLPPEHFVNNGRNTVGEDIVAFPDEASGREALADEDISALYVVEEDYFFTGRVRLVANEYPEEEAELDMTGFLRENVAAVYPPEVAERLLMGSFVKLEYTDSEEATVLTAVEGTFFWKMIIPMAFSVLFSVIIGLINGYMLTSVLDEKANRTVEILLTSTTPLRLMIGKIAGNLAVGLTQMLVWGGLPLVAVVIGAAFLPNFVDMGFDAQLIGISAGLLVLGVLQVSAILTICGAVVVEDREAQQISSVVMLVYMVPYFFFSKLMFEPEGTIATVLSLFPLTAPLSMPFRIALSDVPAGQLVLCFVLALFATAGLLWMAGVAFHRGIMRYEKRLKLKELFSVKGDSNA
jgi:ABC-2 type transport system permease protein